MIVDTLLFLWHNGQLVLLRSLEHLLLVSGAVAMAVIIGVPLGMIANRYPSTANWIISTTTVVMTIPIAALLSIMVPVLQIFGGGLGYAPALLGVLLYSLLPIVRNTYSAISTVAPALRESAAGLGMTPGERLRLVEVPLAIPGIMAGIRIAAVYNIGTVAVAAYLGAGGLGVLVRRGLAQDDPRQLLAGALLLSCLAVLVDTGLASLQRYLTPEGLREPR